MPTERGSFVRLHLLSSGLSPRLLPAPNNPPAFCTDINMGVLDKLKTKESGASDPILTRLVAEDTVPWYKKPQLRSLYFLLFPACMGIEVTSGFDSQMINALQIVPSWAECKSPESSQNMAGLFLIIPRLRPSSGFPQRHHRCCVLSRCNPLFASRSMGQRPIWPPLVHLSWLLRHVPWCHHSRTV